MNCSPEVGLRNSVLTSGEQFLRVDSSLSEAQREAAAAWFEKGLADKTTANLLGVSNWPDKRLYRRWRIHGQGALVTKPTKQSFSFEFKLALVERFLAGETAYQ
jgi:transposase